MQHDPDRLIDACERILPEMASDSAYWQVLLACWVRNGVHRHADRWRALFESTRRNRARGMKKADRRAWRALPPIVVAWRALVPGEDPDRAFSWTIDHAVVERLYRGRTVVRREFPRERVAFLVRRRRESEIIVL